MQEPEAANSYLIGICLPNCWEVLVLFNKSNYLNMKNGRKDYQIALRIGLSSRVPSTAQPTVLEADVVAFGFGNSFIVESSDAEANTQPHCVQKILKRSVAGERKFPGRQ